MIDYNDLRSEWLEIKPNEPAVNIVILKDAVKELRESKKTGNKYPFYILTVKIENEVEPLKFGVFRTQYKQMVDDAGRPQTLVGTKWSVKRVVTEDSDETVIRLLSKLDVV